MLPAMHSRIEECAARALPAAHSENRDGWLIRVSGGGPKRANCVTPLAAAALPWAQQMVYCQALFEQWRTPLTFRLIDHPANAFLDRQLAARGFAELDPSLVMTLDLCRPPCSPEHDWVRLPADTWFNALLELDEADLPRKRRHIELLRDLKQPSVLGAVHGKQDVAAIGLAVIDEEWVGVFDVCCAQACRRQGYGRSLLLGLLSAAYQQGARIAYLQVFARNHAAISLYQSLGFTAAYRYWYRRSRASD